MAKSQRKTQRDSDRLEQLYGNLEKNCPGFKREIVEELCGIRSVAGHYRQNLQSDANVWKRIQKQIREETADLSIETRGLSEAILTLTERGLAKTKDALDGLSDEGLKRPDWLLVCLVRYLEHFGIEGPDLYGTVMAIAVCSGSLTSNEFELPEDFDILNETQKKIELVSDMVRKRVERAREKLPGAVRSELQQYEDLKGVFDLDELGDPMGEWNPRRWMPGGFAVSDPKEKNRWSIRDVKRKRDIRRKLGMYDEDRPEFAEAMFSVNLLMKPRIVLRHRPRRGAILRGSKTDK